LFVPITCRLSRHLLRPPSACAPPSAPTDVPSVIIARTDALGAFLLTSDIDPRDKVFCTGSVHC